MSASNRPMAALMALLVSVTLCGAEAPTPIEREVLTADQDRLDAMVKGDAARLDTLLAADAIYITNAARVDDKRSILYAVRTKSTIYHRIIATERKARVIGEVGVVTGVAAIRGIERKEQVDLTVRYTAVYAKRDGRWQLTAGQSTQLVPNNTVISGQPA